MLPTFHSLAILDRREETSDSFSIAFEVPAALRETYRFRPGQFLTLRATIDGREQRRSYSICVSASAYEHRGELRVAIRRMPLGVFSNWAHAALHAGSTVDVLPPDGRFFVPLDATLARHHVAFAGGSGITPILSLIETTLETEPRSRFTLIYGNRSVGSIMFIERLEDLKNRYLDRLRLYHVLSDEVHEVPLYSGLLDQNKCREFLCTLVAPSDIDCAFICGPQPMMDAAERALREAGVAAQRIHIERFGTPAPDPVSQPRAAIAPPAGQAADPAGAADVVIIADGKQRRLRIAADGPAILDAGLAAGIDLPYACKGGVCCTCRARVIEGSVRMELNYTLEDHEVAAGFVLSCQSHPSSARVVISYDER